MMHHSGVENPLVTEGAAEEVENPQSAKKREIKKIIAVPFSRGRRVVQSATVVAAGAIEKGPENPYSARRWAIGSAVGGMACMVAAYGTVESFQSAVTNGSPGEGIEGLGFLPITAVVAGATAEMLSTYRKKREAAQWHEAVAPEQPEKPAAAEATPLVV